MKFIFYLLSKVYSFVVSLRLLGYKLKIFSAAQFKTPIISIGNIEAGGTGKTPMTIYLSQLLKNKQISHVVVSRGYKKKLSGTVVVSDQNSILVKSPKQCGDEPFLMANRLSNTPIIVGDDKKNAIQIAIQKFNPQIIILDDAFQSLYINKHSDIVLFNCLHSKETFNLLPAGLLREPIHSILRAQLVVFTKYNLLTSGNLPNPAQAVLQLVKQNNIPYLFAEHKSRCVQYCLNTHTLNNVKNNIIHSNPALAISGIADSLSFNLLCQKYFSNIVATHNFSDHFSYHNFYVFLKSLYKTTAFSSIVTTHKDLVKIKELDSSLINWLINQKIQLFVIEIDLVIDDSENKIPLLLKSLSL